MYLHVGNHKNIRTKDIIGIFDLDHATVARTTRTFLSSAEKRGEVTSAGEELPRAFVLYRDGGENRICFSLLSSTALAGRCEE